ncbi:choice-of-anchor Q domain-containing protein [Marinicella sp. W31]|uniref:choice-of-anchor Q domain-containing protein n=1 Tax=Marinicella sp. W31 TaxID=3023713 RepID=UPI00375635B2
MHGSFSHIKQSALLAAILLECGGLIATPAQAATIHVDDDSNCNLASAIQSANTDTPVDGCASGAGADEIVLPNNANIVLDAELPLISSQIYMMGNNSTLSRNSKAAAFRLMTAENANLSIDDLTLRGGLSPNTGYATDYGAAIRIQGGQLSLAGVTVENNTGVALAILETAGSTIENSKIRNNIGLPTYFSGGGGIHVSGSTLQIITSSISNNQNVSFGSGGGGMYISNQYGVSNVTVLYSSIINNSSYRSGGAINAVTSGAGGSDSIVLNIRNTTISGNSSGENGGGIACNLITASVVSSTISNNSTTGAYSSDGSGGGIFCGIGFPPAGSSLQIEQSILSGNTANTGAEIFDAAAVTLDAYNVLGQSGQSGVAGMAVAGVNDVVVDVPTTQVLAPLNQYVGNAEGLLTHDLLFPSPAVDVVPLAVDCVGVDQHGELRPKDGNNSGEARCDAGAVEFVYSDVIFVNGFE